MLLKRKSKRPLMIFLLFSLLLIEIFGATASSNTEDRIAVVVSIAPLAGIVEAVGSYRVSVEVLIPEGVEPHTLQASPELIKKAMEADLIVHTGHFPFEEELVKITGKPSVGLEDYKAHGLSLSPMPGRIHTGDGTGVNMHGYWLKPDNALAIAEAVTEKLKEIDIDHSDVYTRELNSFEAKIERLKSYINEISDEYGLKNFKAVITFPAEAYVAEAFGIEVEESLVIGENVFVGGKALMEIEDRLRMGEVNFILSSEMAKQMKAGEFAQRLASDTGSPLIYVRVLTFGDLHDYTALIMYNAGVLTASIDALEHTGTTSEQTNQWPYIIAIVVLAFIGAIEAILLIKKGK